MQESEAEAMRLCQQGDISGLEILVQRYQLAALRLAYLVIGERALAEDIVQDSFLHVYRASTQFRVNSPFAPWFYQIVLNTARQHRRKVSQHTTVSLDDLAGASIDDRASYQNMVQRGPTIADPYQQVERTEQREAIVKALAQLTPKQREAIILRYYYGFNEHEMATILRCLTGTVKWRLHAGMQALERAIRSQCAWLIEQSPAETVPEKLLVVIPRKDTQNA